MVVALPVRGESGAIERVSLSSSGAQQNGASHNPVLSSDGRYVAFRSSASNLVASDTNAQQDVFVRDRQTATTTRVSVASGGGQSTGGASDEPAISDDGRFVAFQSDATNLVASDTNALTDAFLHDRQSATTSRVSVSSAGAQATGGPSGDPAIDGDGDTVAFESTATNLVPSDTNAKEDVFVRRTASSTTLRASASTAGVQGTSGSNDPSLSSDGNRVGFASTASNLVAGETNSRNDSFLRDLAAGTTVRKSLTQSGAQANEASSDPWLSGDGLSLSFRSVATNLVPEDTDATPDVYVRGPGTDASAYAYDRLSRLTSATEPGLGATTYTYDPAGNRLTRVRGATSTAYTYDRADRITAAGATGITVSAVGTTTARGTDSFAYDQANRLRTATVAGTSETSVYDGDGVRFSRQVGAGPVTRYVTDPAAGLPVTVDDGTRKYVWGLGLAYAVSGSTLEVYHADRLGSTRALTGATGAVTATYRTDEFGTPTTVTGTSSQPFRYTGEPLDASGLTYLRARYYDASIGRFMSRDPWIGAIAIPLTTNRYSYVLNNAPSLSDPTGLMGIVQPHLDGAKARVLDGGYSAAICGNVTIGVAGRHVGFGTPGTLCAVKDDTGRRAILLTVGSGVQLPRAFSGAAGVQLANGRIDDLLLGFVQVGASGPGPYRTTVGIDVSGDPSDLEPWVLDLSIGLTSAPGPEAHFLVTNTILVSEEPRDLNQLGPLWDVIDALLQIQNAF